MIHFIPIVDTAYDQPSFTCRIYGTEIKEDYPFLTTYRTYGTNYPHQATAIPKIKESIWPVEQAFTMLSTEYIPKQLQSLIYSLSMKKGEVATKTTIC